MIKMRMCQPNILYLYTCFFKRIIYLQWYAPGRYIEYCGCARAAVNGKVTSRLTRTILTALPFLH